MSTDNDRIFVSTSYMNDSAVVAWAASSSGILSPDDSDQFVGELMIHMDGRATLKWWDGDTPYVLVIEPLAAVAPGDKPFVAIYVTEDQPPMDDARPVWKSQDLPNLAPTPTREPSDKRTIRRKFKGGSEEQSFREFADSTIQDEDAAIRVARRMLEGDDGNEYEWNADEPEFYETFEIIDRAGLVAQLPTMLVHVVAFRHKVPGEGVGGFEWDVDPEQARSRIRAAGVYDDPNYETVEYSYDTGELTLADKDEITDRIDHDAWVERGR